MSTEKQPDDKVQDLKKIDADKAEQVKGGMVNTGNKFKHK